jgi:hypothetical protein
MKSFAERYREERRLVLLRCLSDRLGFRANTSNLHTMLQALGVMASRDDVVTDLAWLRDQGLVRLEQIEEVPDLHIAAITKRGHDVALGHAAVPGVMNPGPK